MFGHRKFVLLLALLLAVGLLLVGCGGAGGKEQSSSQEKSPGEKESSENKPTITLRLGHVTQTSHPYHLAMEKFAEVAAEKSGGRIQVQIYPARQLGGDREMFEMVQSGSLDMNLMPTATLGGFTPVMVGLQLPWLIENYDILEKVFLGEPAQKLFDALEKEVNVKPLGLIEAGFRHFVNTKRPINKVEDLKGLKFRAVQSPLILDIQKALGISPTPMPYGEIYSSLQTGVIDGSDLEIASVWTEKFYEVAEYISISSHISFPAVLVMNTDKWNSLSPEDQNILEEAAREATIFNIQNVKEFNEEALRKVQEKGMKVNKIEDLSSFKAAVQPVYDKYTAQHPIIKEFVEDVLKLKGEK
ncbi:TRAP transporter substrate-binding protein [Calderihabitans maritimus]|uniref:TRAP dicarboxylate transporter subunit DctP n=1 Tax=Calderihabitans maritimus TaxID=1246530 RepID=A0A1Z5HWK6_9FIRM|nr:TRAP transporter substrate-binding protein [Calderihabitans maritimus]GAW93798.1 hypothetical protein KKC1_29250 [Calderihabitans maritimus]